MQSLTQKVDFIENIFGKGILSKGNNITVRCPLCNDKNPNKKKLAIRLSDDAHHCWVCGWKSYSLAPLIKKFGTASQLEEYRKNYKKDNFLHSDNTENKENKEISLPGDFKLLVECYSNNPEAKAAINYLKSRGLTTLDIWRLRIGISNDPVWKRRVIFPSFDQDGNLNFYIGRNIDKEDKRPKYYQPFFDTSQFVFNEISINWSKPIILCEGIFDSIKCGQNSIPLFSSDFILSSRLFSLIAMNNSLVYIALDSNMKDTKTVKLFKVFESFNIDSKIVDLGNFEDPGSMSKSQFKECLKRAFSPNWEESFQNKLNLLSNVRLSL